MRMISRLTMTAAGVLSLALAAGCAGNNPRRPTAAEDKSSNSATRFSDSCYEAQSRGAPPPIGCPATDRRAGETRTTPTLTREPLQMPELPGQLPGGGVLRR